MSVQEPVIDETEQEFLEQGIAVRYYKCGVRYQPFIMVGDRFQGLGIFKTVEKAREQKESYISSFNQIVQPYIKSDSLAYFKAVDNGEKWVETDEED